MSHDFVEAALLRRAGWGVHMVPALSGSYEEGPPSLADVSVRDRRWCQGNLQHAAVLPARGLHWVSRLHLMMGIGAYTTAPLWLAFLLVGILLSLETRFELPDYFPAGPTLFPHWPVVDPVRSKWVFILTMGVLLGPKLLAALASRAARVGAAGVRRRVSDPARRGDRDGAGGPDRAGRHAHAILRGGLDPFRAGRRLEPAAARGRAGGVERGRSPLLAAFRRRVRAGHCIRPGLGAAPAVDDAGRARAGPCHSARRLDRPARPGFSARPRRAAGDARGTGTAGRPFHGRQADIGLCTARAGRNRASAQRSKAARGASSNAAAAAGARRSVRHRAPGRPCQARGSGKPRRHCPY